MERRCDEEAGELNLPLSWPASCLTFPIPVAYWAGSTRMLGLPRCTHVDICEVVYCISSDGGGSSVTTAAVTVAIIVLIRSALDT